jgi:hypothetical protein
VPYAFGMEPRLAAMLARYYMIGLMGKQRFCVPHATVFATALCTLSHRATKSNCDPIAHASMESGLSEGRRERMSITMRSNNTS